MVKPDAKHAIPSRGAAANRRVPVSSTDAAKLVAAASDYVTPGADWDYYNTIYKLLDFAGDWPAEMSGHFAWQDEGSFRVVGLWSSHAAVERFFAEVTIERVSRAIQLLGAIPSRDGAVDVEPNFQDVLNLIMGPLARYFSDIGEDRDGTAISILGTEPMVVRLDVVGMNAETYAQLIALLGYDNEIPAELISHFAMRTDEGVRIFESWPSSGHANAVLGTSVLPAIEELARKNQIDLEPDHSMQELRRIALSDAIVRAFGY